MAFRYSEMGYDGCSCIIEDARCHKCNQTLSGTDGLFCADCESETQQEKLEATECLLDELGGYVTNI